MSRFANIEQSYGTELIRKGIHLCSLVIPVGYYFVDKSLALSILIPVTAAFALTDGLRVLFPAVAAIYHRLFGWLLRSAERNTVIKRLNGATYVLLSACICVWVFPKVVAITAFSILIVSDTVAALVGRKLGKRPFFSKTFEGSLAFFLSSVLVVVFAPKISHDVSEYMVGIAGGLLGTIVESLSISIDDNLTIPLSIGATMWVLYFLFLPALNVFALDTR
jgi:dolichol kinase